MKSRLSIMAGLVLVVGVACTPGATNAPTGAAATQAAPTSAAATTPAATDAASEAPATSAAGATVEAEEVGDAGVILVAGSNGMTVYNFEMDTADSGESACSGECIANWPPLTVAEGETPAGGSGVTGELGTITRDDGTLQVTYNGLPLYFFANDQEPGDLDGVYENWVTVAP